MTYQPPSPRPLVLTRAGVLLGIRMALPTIPALVALALAFGAAAAGRGMTPGEAVAMSAFVSAGAAQMLSLELWRDLWSLTALATVAAVTATVNARFILMGASLQPWLAGAGLPRRAGALFFLFDTSWLLTERHASEGGRDLGVFLGVGIFSWAIWVAATLPGHLLGSLIQDPRRYALDLVMPFFFAALAVPLWRGPRRSGIPWLTSGIVALAVQALVPGYAFIVAGALSGAVAGALIRAPR